MTPAAVLLGRLLSGVGAFLFALALGGIGLANQLGTGRTGSPVTTLFHPINPFGVTFTV